MRWYDKQSGFNGLGDEVNFEGEITSNAWIAEAVDGRVALNSMFSPGGLPAMSTQLKLVFSLALAFVTASARADSIVYVTTFSQQFGTVNLATGAFNAIGPGTPEQNAGLIPAANGSLLTLTVSGNLDSINPATGATTVIGATGLGGSAFSFAESGGTLYATDLSNNLYTVNPTTGLATLIGPTGMPPDPSIPFTTNPDGSLNLCDESLYGIGGKLYATFDAFAVSADGSSTVPEVNPDLWQIDPTTGVATEIGPTTDHILSSVEVNETLFAFQGTINSTYNFFDPGPLIQLVTLDTSNGSTSLVTDVDPAAGAIFGAAPVPTPEPGSLALVGTGFVAIAAGWRRLQRA
jgi:hypothetical protein